MKITTWNVNGIRSLKKSINEILSEFNSDVVCFQETKVSRSQISEEIALIDGYTSYFSYPQKQSGYSGVSTYCKDAWLPDHAEDGLTRALNDETDADLINHISSFSDSPSDISELDSEGRVMITYNITKVRLGNTIVISRLAVINVYCPRVDPEKPERHLYKMQFCHLLEGIVKRLSEKRCSVIIVGDFNIAHSVIDHCDPGDVNEFNSSEARQWLKSFFSTKFRLGEEVEINIVDAFRHLHPDRKNAYTCWNTKTAARLTNFGTRIDYILIGSDLLHYLIKCDIMSDYEGSDHCPVFAELNMHCVLDDELRLPSICTRMWPKFTCRQQNIKNFLKKTQALADKLTNTPESSMPPLTDKKHQLKAKDKQKSIINYFTNASAPKTDSKNAAVSEDKELGKGFEIKQGTSSQKCTDSDACEAFESSAASSSKSSQVSEWKSVLRGPPKPPLCSGHKKECVLRTVKKKGPNYGRQFFMCAQPAGHSTNPDANCNYFKWVSAAKTNSLK